VVSDVEGVNMQMMRRLLALWRNSKVWNSVGDGTNPASESFRGVDPFGSDVVSSREPRAVGF
jgi:hypothetical protein